MSCDSLPVSTDATLHQSTAAASLTLLRTNCRVHQKCNCRWQFLFQCFLKVIPLTSLWSVFWDGGTWGTGQDVLDNPEFFSKNNITCPWAAHVIVAVRCRCCATVFGPVWQPLPLHIPAGIKSLWPPEHVQIPTRLFTGLVLKQCEFDISSSSARWDFTYNLSLGKARHGNRNYRGGGTLISHHSNHKFRGSGNFLSPNIACKDWNLTSHPHSLFYPAWICMACRCSLKSRGAGICPILTSQRSMSSCHLNHSEGWEL